MADVQRVQHELEQAKQKADADAKHTSNHVQQLETQITEASCGRLPMLID